MEIFEQLNFYQKEAVIDESSTTLVNANVGSGKTTVLISKVFYLHYHKNVDFNDMVILTFTNKAAEEIKNRITDLDSSIQAENMQYFGTFHSVALKMLKTFLPLEKVGYTSSFTVIDTDELLEMAIDLIGEKGFKIKYKNKLKKRFEDLKTGKTSYASMKYDDDIEALWETVCIEKKKQNKMDFDDLIINAMKLLEKSSFSPKWIIIDEFQDCDDNQLNLLKSLKNERTKIFAVGDPNQVIYSWRGSRKNIFSEFKKKQEVKELTLTINYRSTTTILEAAKCFLSDGTELKGTKETGNLITLQNHYDPFNEAKYLADKIGELHNNGVPYSDIAVLYRMQKQSQVLEDVFVKEKIPYEVSVKKTLCDIPVLRWYLNLLKASVNDKDTANLVSVLKDKTYGEGMTKSKIRKTVFDKSYTSSKLYQKICGFEKWCLEQVAPYDIYSYFDLDSFLLPTSIFYEENKRQVVTFTNTILEYIDFEGCSLLEGIRNFVSSSALYGIEQISDCNATLEDSIKLMTLHACKGLEFRYVFIIGANYGLIPLNTASLEEQEEEKRLFFVGITRAIDNLEISYYTSPGSPRVMSGQSSYLYMLPEHLIRSSNGTDSKSNLNAFRREIKNNMEKIEKCEKDEGVNEEIKSRVKHERYGIGTIESDDDDTITVLFEGYGTKEFIKAFHGLEFL